MKLKQIMKAEKLSIKEVADIISVTPYHAGVKLANERFTLEEIRKILSHKKFRHYTFYDLFWEDL